VMSDAQVAEKKKVIGNYELGAVLGEGAFSKVRLAVDQRTKKEVAVKIVNQSLIQNIKDMERVIREIHVLKNIRHPNIIRLFEAIDKGTHVYLVMEHAGGGELYEYIARNGPFSMSEAKRIFHQVLSGVDYCHRQMVSHRDLKPENVLLDNEMNAKVIDFGLSNDMQPGALLKTTCGSPCYAAPEMIQGKKYDGTQIDVWSCGVILYCMVCGKLPFDDEQQPELFRKITAGIYTIPDDVSSDVADLIRQFLTVQPEKRITIAQAWQHPWLASLNSTAPLSSEDDAPGPPSLGLEEAAEAMALGPAPDEPATPSTPSALASAKAMGDELVFELLPHHSLPASLLVGERDEAGHLFMRIETGATEEKTAGRASPAGGVSMARAGRARVVGSKGKPEDGGAAQGGASTDCIVFLPRKKDVPGGGVGGRTQADTPARASPGLGRGRGASLAGTSGTPRREPAVRSPTAARAAVGAPGADRKPGLPTAAKAASAAAAKSAKEENVNDELYNDPKLAGALMCAVTKKEPRAIVRDIQKLFSDLKVLLRAASSNSIKGEKNKMRFELSTSLVVSVNGAPAPRGEALYIVQATKLAGDIHAYREVVRKLLNKL